jgi:hypothetical protein
MMPLLTIYADLGPTTRAVRDTVRAFIRARTCPPRSRFPQEIVIDRELFDDAYVAQAQERRLQLISKHALSSALYPPGLRADRRRPSPDALRGPRAGRSAL